MDMAVGVIIGGAFSGIVTSLTDNFINPVLNVLTGGKIYSLEDVAGFASSFLSAVVNFIIMAFILFCLMKAINKLVNLSKPEEKPAAPTTKVCPFCQSKNYLGLQFLMTGRARAALFQECILSVSGDRFHSELKSLIRWSLSAVLVRWI